MNPCPALPVPTVGRMGVTLLVLALLTAGTVLVAHRRAG